MPRLPKFFGRKQVAEAPGLQEGGDTPADDAALHDSSDASGAENALDLSAKLPGAPAADEALQDAGEADARSAPTTETGDAAEVDTEREQGPVDQPVALHAVADTAPAADADPIPEPAVAPPSSIPPPIPDTDRRGSVESKTLIGGKEADLVPMIPDTEVDIPDTTELDEEAIASATVEALFGACELMVNRVHTLRKMQDGTQIVAGLIALVSELDVRYTRDWGIVRRNGLEEVLIEVRESAVEGDRFILESLENGKGGLTAEVFLRDLRTIAPADRSRMVTAYATFLVFVLKCVLRQYLRPLENDQLRLRDVTRRLDYLIDGVRDTLLSRISGIPRAG